MGWAESYIFRFWGSSTSMRGTISLAIENPRTWSSITILPGGSGSGNLQWCGVGLRLRLR